jgi:hypothetical protein
LGPPDATGFSDHLCRRSILYSGTAICAGFLYAGAFASTDPPLSNHEGCTSGLG